MILFIPKMWPFLNLFLFQWPQSKHSEAFKYRIFIFTELFYGYIDMGLHYNYNWQVMFTSR